MRDLLLAVPSRGRPQNIARLWRAMAETCGSDTELIVGLDEDDPARDRYPAGPLYVVRKDLHQVVGWINELVIPRAAGYRAVGHIGDDNVPRTAGWDTSMLDALGQTPFAFANDLYPREPGSLSCHVFCRSEVIAALGWMGPPTIRHMYVDGAWMLLGKACGITYLHDVIIEHLHYTVGKSVNDETYAASFAMDPADRKAFLAWCFDPGGLNGDIEKIQAATDCPGQGPFTLGQIREETKALNVQ